MEVIIITRKGISDNPIITDKENANKVFNRVIKDNFINEKFLKEDFNKLSKIKDFEKNLVTLSVALDKRGVEFDWFTDIDKQSIEKKTLKNKTHDESNLGYVDSRKSNKSYKVYVPNRDDLIKSLRNFKKAWEDLSIAWNDEWNNEDLAPDEYPFESYFDGYKIKEWVDSAIADAETFEVEVETTPMTVGFLLKKFTIEELTRKLSLSANVFAKENNIIYLTDEELRELDLY